MTKFYGEIGYGTSVEKAAGVWDDVVVEYSYYGDVIRNTRRFEPGENLNSNITTSNSISIVADAYACENFFAIRYIKWAGTLWTVTNVEVKSPRLILTLGGVYNGYTP
jgi:hypothetical protein